MEATRMLRHEGKQDLVDDELGRRLEKLSREVGISPRELVREAVEEFAASRKRSNRTEGATKLGCRLRAIRAKIVRSGIPLLDIDELDRELANGRRERDR